MSNNTLEENSENLIDMYTVPAENSEPVFFVDPGQSENGFPDSEYPGETVGGDADFPVELPSETVPETFVDFYEEYSKTEAVTGEPQTETSSAPRTGITAFMQRYHLPVIIVLLLMLAAVCAAIAIVLKKKIGKGESAARQRQTISPQPYEDTDEPTEQLVSRNVINSFKTQETDNGVSSDYSFAGSGRVNIISMQNIGNRPNQEDSYGYSDVNDQTLTGQKGVLGVVADGMGGLAGGEEVSALLVEDMLRQFSDLSVANDPVTELDRLLNHAVLEVNGFLSQTVGLRKSGSTLTAVICKEMQLSWVSVGDSRIALLRNGRLTTLNERHVYGAELDEMVRLGKMTKEEAQNNTHRGELTSYVGMGDVKYVDRSVRPLNLQAGDKVILMSDGIFNALNDKEIASILQLPSDMIAEALENGVLSKQKKYQDNYTALIFEI